jgi:hypothetical protein
MGLRELSLKSDEFALIRPCCADLMVDREACPRGQAGIELY